MSDKKHHEEGNAIDHLDADLKGASEKIVANKKPLAIVLGIIVIAALAVAGYFYLLRNPQNEKAFDAYGKVEVNNPAASDTILANEYKKVADQYDGTDAANLAAVEAAEHFYEIGKYQDALNYLNKFSTSNEVLSATTTIMKGDCYVNLKKYDEAISQFQKAAADAADNDQIVPLALIKCATVYDAQKKYDKALEIYEQLYQRNPNYAFNGMTMEAYIEREKARLGK